MADADDDAKSGNTGSPDASPTNAGNGSSGASILETALKRMREAQADRDDVVVEMRLAARGRLELLARELQPLFDELPDDNDQFEFALTDGENPRLWIDMTSFVRMGRDRRSYEFVKDTRLGRTLLAQTNDRAEIVRRVADYVAERVIERERALEGEWMAMRDHDFETGKPQRKAETPEAAKAAARASSSPWKTFAVFVLGVVAGACGLFAWAWFGAPPL